MNMSGKDVLRLLLISYGFCRNIEISTYIGDGGWIGYEVSASNDDGIEYYAVDCEGLLFHIYEIQKFMRDGNMVELCLKNVLEIMAMVDTLCHQSYVI